MALHRVPAPHALPARPARPAQLACRTFIVAAALMMLACVGVQAQSSEAPVYRCGNTYSSAPCPGGKPVDAADPRSAAQQKEARAAVQRDARMADELAAERRAREKAAAGQQAAGIGPLAAAPAAPAASKAKKKTNKQPKQPKQPTKTAPPKTEKPAKLGQSG